MKGAVFFDKDGTLVENVPYSVDPADIAFRCGAIAALHAARDLGYAIFIVSNQPGLALGRFPREALDRYFARLVDRLESEGIKLAAWYACPHGREPLACACRKPQPGMLLQAAREHAIDLARSWMVGDILDDVEAGCRAGCRTVLIDSGGETEWLNGPCRVPDFTFPTLEQLGPLLHRQGMGCA